MQKTRVYVSNKVLFQLVSDFSPAGDQPRAIAELVSGLEDGLAYQTVLGVTGSGKTFTVAQVINQVQRPTLVMAHNKTLAAQLYSEMRDFFPNNAVEYFVSYYDYYQPEAYVPASGVYIEKDAAVNEQIEQMRLSAVKSLLERRDTIIVATVSAIYGLGDPADYLKMVLSLRVGDKIDQRAILRRLATLQYKRNDIAFTRATYRVKGDTIDIYPAESDEEAVRLQLFDDELERISFFDPLTGRVLSDAKRITIYPRTHFATPRARILSAMEKIKVELKARLLELRDANRLVEAQRLEERTQLDLEMMGELGYCSGIENYSRLLTDRVAGSAPATLLDYLPEDALLVVDESHVTIPQIGAMYRGDRARKENLVNYGFRLPSALDNRPLRFDEFETRSPQTIFVSATPGTYEGERSNDVIELLVRPTGLLDPKIEVRPVGSQIDDLLSEINKRAANNERVLVTTLTKRMSEDLTEYLSEHGVKVRYLHSDIDTVERVEILRDLRKGVFDVLIGINLLREGLDLPEVSLVAILDADKPGFLRSERALIQTIGRAARHVDGMAILYGDRITPAMKFAIDETKRRRHLQDEYNQQHGITPTGIKKALVDILDTKKSLTEAQYIEKAMEKDIVAEKDRFKHIAQLREEMYQAAKNLAFEEAGRLRDKIQSLK